MFRPKRLNEPTAKRLSDHIDVIKPTTLSSTVSSTASAMLLVQGDMRTRSYLVGAIVELLVVAPVFAATMAKWNLLQAKDLPHMNAQLKGGGLAPLAHGTALQCRNNNVSQTNIRRSPETICKAMPYTIYGLLLFDGTPS